MDGFLRIGYIVKINQGFENIDMHLSMLKIYHTTMDILIGPSMYIFGYSAIL